MYRLLYFCIFAAAGLSVTFWPYHLTALGLSDSETGLVFGVRTTLSIAAQLGLAAMGGRLRRPGAALALLMGWGLLAALGMPWATSGWVMAALVWLQTPATGTATPLLDTLVVTTGDPRRFGRIRLWGSLGYGVSVASFGLAADALGLDHAAAGALSTPTYVVLCGLGFLVALPLLKAPAIPPRTAAAPSLRALTRTPGLLPFFAANALHWAAISIFNVFFPLHTRALHHGNAVPGVAVFVAVAAEALAFAVAGRLFNRLAPARWLPWVLGAGVVRWLLTAWCTGAAALIAAQALHALSFGVWLSVVMELLGRFTGREGRASLQALFFAAVFGGGGVLGTLGGGILMERGGGPLAFTAAAALEVLAFAVFLPALRRLPAAP